MIGNRAKRFPRQGDPRRKEAATATDDNMDGQEAQYADNAMRAIREKKQLPEIDFTLHTMEDGSTVSTQERVCKGMSPTMQEEDDAREDGR